MELHYLPFVFVLVLGPILLGRWFVLNNDLLSAGRARREAQRRGLVDGDLKDEAMHSGAR